MKLIHIICWGALLGCLSGVSPLLSQRADIQAVMENLYDDIEDEEWLNERYRQLVWLSEHPVNIHQEDLNMLIEYQLLTELQRFYLRAYLAKHKKMNSLYELDYIEGFSSQDRERLQFFVEVKPINTIINQATKHRFFISGKISMAGKMVLEKAAGYQQADSSAAGYAGSRPALRMDGRLKMGKNLTAGWLAEKDAGEPFGFKYGMKGFDLYAGFLSWESTDKKLKLILGNFKLQTGQGMGFTSAGQTYTSYAQPEQIKKFHGGFKAYAGGEENNRLQGIAASAEHGPVEIGVYYSLNQRDASLTLTTDSMMVIQSLPATASHVDSLSLARRKASSEQNLGAYLQFRLKTLQTGIRVNRQSYSYPLEVPGTQDENYDKPFTYLSADYQFALWRLHFFGEFALNPAGYLFHIQGLQYSPISAVNLGISYQNEGTNAWYREDARKVLFPSSGANKLYLGMRLNLSRQWQMNISLNRIRNAIPDNSLDMPSEKTAVLIRTIYQFNKNTQAYLQLKRSSEAIETMSNDYFNFPDDHQFKYSLRIHFQYTISDKLKQSFRFENQSLRLGDKALSNGQILYLGFHYFPIEGLEIRCRYALFSIQDYEVSYWVSEDELPAFFSGELYQGNGNRYYILLKYKVDEKWQVYLKLSQSLYFNGMQIGSGLNSLDGFAKSEMKLMISWYIQ